MTELILRAIGRAGYLGIFALMALENIFPPIPSEAIMGLGGMAVARGDMALGPLVAIGTAGSTLGNYWWYWIGRRVGYERFRPFVERHGRWLTLDWPAVERLHRLFQRRGDAIVFVFRFMPAFRTTVSLPAGMAAMPRWRFLAWTYAGAAIWDTLLAVAGMELGRRVEAIDRYLGPAAIAFTAIGIAWYLWRVATWKRR